VIDCPRALVAKDGTVLCKKPTKFICDGDCEFCELPMEELLRETDLMDEE